MLEFGVSKQLCYTVCNTTYASDQFVKGLLIGLLANN